MNLEELKELLTNIETQKEEIWMQFNKTLGSIETIKYLIKIEEGKQPSDNKGEENEVL